MRIDELKAKRADSIKAAQALIDKAETETRGLTDEEATEVRGHQDEAERLAGLIELEERQAALNDGLDTDPPKPEPDGGKRAKAAAGIVKDEKPFSLMAALRSFKRNGTLPKNEERISAELGEYFERESRSFFMPVDAMLPQKEQHEFHRQYRSKDRDLMEEIELREIGKVAPTTAGAAIVATNLLVDRFIELLDSDLVVAQLGATMIPGLVGDVDIPRQATGATAGWIATEGGNTATSELTTDLVSMTPKTVSNKQLITRRMLMQSTPGIEDLVRADNRRALAKAIDTAALVGAGTGGVPRGVTATAGIGLVTLSATPTYAEVVEFETDLDEADAPGNGRGWVMRPASSEVFKTTVKAAGTATYLMQEDGTMNGYASAKTTIMPALTVLFGAFPELLVGMWGVFDAQVDPYTQGDSGGLVLRSFQDVDTTVRHPESFSLGALV